MTIVSMRSAVLWLWLLVVVLAAAAQGEQQASPAAPSSLTSYVARLDALSDAVRAASADDRASASRLLSQLPPEWVVTSSEQTWRVPTASIHSALADWQSHRDAPHREAVLVCLGIMRTQANAFAGPPADGARARDRLADVLRAEEFRGVRGPSAFERLRRQAIAWLTDLLSRLFGSSLIPIVGSVVIYVVIGLAVLASALVMVRVLRRTVRAETAALDLVAQPARAWDDWFSRAQIAAADAQWAEAIRLSYWCGVAFLESRGAWQPDSSRTPREYLALVSSGPPAAGLGVLTSLLERAWYGRAVADASSFDEAVGCLRSMGCPVE